MADARRFGLDEVVAHFQELEGPRSEINRKHPLASVVVIALIAVLAVASGPTAIAQWAATVADQPDGFRQPCRKDTALHAHLGAMSRSSLLAPTRFRRPTAIVASPGHYGRIPVRQRPGFGNEVDDS